MKKPRDGSDTAGLMFLPDISWTLAQATEEQARAEAMGNTGPRSPLFQWVALNEIEQLRRQFEMGDDFAVLQAVAKCAQHGLIMPAWLSKNYLHRYRKVAGAEVGSWDEAFGRPYGKGKHLQKLRQRRELRFSVYNEIRARLIQAPDTPIDDELFETVGATFKIGKTLCNELYYEAVQLISGVSSTFVGAVAGELLKPLSVKAVRPAAKKED